MAHIFDTLAKESYISLKTRKKDGTTVNTPVWFAHDNNKLYVMTLASAGKAKRVRNFPQIELAPCDARGRVHGEFVPATAHLLADGTHANTLLTRKYGLFKRLFDFFQRNKERVYIEITA